MKNKKYRNYYSKIYFEEFAKIVLNEYCNLNLIHRQEKYNMDRPDLISTDENIGVEVTQSVTQKEAKRNKVLQYIYPLKDKKAILNMAKRLNVLEEITLLMNKENFKNIYSTKEIQNKLLNSINKKIICLNKKGFNIYPHNYLFLFIACENADILSVHKQIKDLLEKKIKHNFHKIFVLNLDTLFLIDSKEIQTILIEHNTFTKIKTEALAFAKKHLNTH